ncbi:hypothetical protein GcC1_169012, partial [Golovinomyces cichoracearum]
MPCVKRMLEREIEDILQYATPCLREIVPLSILLLSGVSYHTIKISYTERTFITSLTKMNFKTPDETTIIRYLSTAAISSAAVSLIDADTIAKATINDMGQATASQLNAYALLRIMDYKTNSSTYSDLNLLHAFKENF